MRDVFAIVGSEYWPNSSYEDMIKDLIRVRLEAQQPDRVVSGGANGVDRWAVEVARELGIAIEQILPKRRQWVPDGFRDRNMAIAQTCTRLLAIRSKSARRYGSGWTADYAEGLGRPVERVIL